MGNYEQLKEAIKAVIKTNGKQEITGQVMQDTLLAITSSFGQGALFAGIATPETNPLTPDQNVFYLARKNGIYVNFGGVEILNEIAFLMVENNKWVKKYSMPIKSEEEEKNIEAYAYQNNIFSNNGSFNKIVKELFVKEDIDVSDAVKGRIYNGFAGLYGITLFNSENVKILDITSKNKQDIIISPDGISKVLMDYTYSDSEWKDYNIALSPNVHNLSYSQVLSFAEINGKKTDLYNENLYATVDFQPLIIEGSPSIVQVSAYSNVYFKNNIYKITGTTYTELRLEANTCAYIDLVKPTSTTGLSEINIGSIAAVMKLSNVLVLFAKNADSVTWGALIQPYINADVSRAKINLYQYIADRELEYIKGYYIASNGLAVSKATGSRLISTKGVSNIYIEAKSNPVIYALLKSKDLFNIEYSEGFGRKVLNASQNITFNVTEDAQWLYVSDVINNVDYSPLKIEFNNDGYNYAESLINYTKSKTKEIESKIENITADGKGTYFDKFGLSPNRSSKNNDRPLIYKGDTKDEVNHLVNAVVYPNGIIIGARAGVGVVKIDLNGTETTLLNITGATDWRCLYMDSKLNIFASPHSSAGNVGEPMPMTARGLYKLTYGGSLFTKVISLYNPDSSIPSEAEVNDDTIWTMCEDNEGILYAGVYSHTKHHNPAIYKSTDGGDNWVYAYNFNTSGATTNGHHIHSIIYNIYDNSLYAIVGEINTVFKSSDKSVTWTNLNAPCKNDKGSAMYATSTGILIGSDGAYNCAIAKLYPDGTVKDRGLFAANTVFAFRKSDYSGRIYAFCKIDSSVTSDYYFPPIEAISDESYITQWKASATQSSVQKWEDYNTITKKLYPEDAVKPQHCMILASDDDGETWYLVYREFVGAFGASGFWTTGYFRNGECLTGHFVKASQTDNIKTQTPLIINERGGNYTSGGVDISESVYSKTMTVKILNNDAIL